REGDGPAGGGRCVEGDGERGGQAERHTRGAEHEAAAPVQTQPFPCVRELQVAGAHECHRAVSECRDRGPRQHGQDEQRGDRDGEDYGEDEDRSERRVDEHQPPGVLVQVADREPESTAGAHPFTPADTTPETKKRWKTRKMIRTGTMAMIAPAEISGHNVPYVKCSSASPSWMV